MRHAPENKLLRKVKKVFNKAKQSIYMVNITEPLQEDFILHSPQIIFFPKYNNTVECFSQTLACQKLASVGLTTAFCNWLLDFLTLDASLPQNFPQNSPQRSMQLLSKHVSERACDSSGLKKNTGLDKSAQQSLYFSTN